MPGQPRGARPGGSVTLKPVSPKSNPRVTPLTAPQNSRALCGRVSLTVGNRPGYRSNRPGPVTVSAGYQPVGLKNFEFEFKKLKNVEKSQKILRDLLSLMVSIFLQTSFI
jgi:hypothetical protein